MDNYLFTVRDSETTLKQEVHNSKWEPILREETADWHTAD